MTEPRSNNDNVIGIGTRENGTRVVGQRDQRSWTPEPLERWNAVE